MKNKIKKWLGVSNLELLIGEEEPTNRRFSTLDYIFNYSHGITIISRHKRLREDFEELDKKFDALERYLKIEFYKKDEETQIYDWADKNHTEGFRKASKTYEEMKAGKKNSCECDD